jgi:hypothetical protein
MNRSQPPSSQSPSSSSLFYLGRNSRGQWVVRDQQHRRGGLFVNRAEALKFAMFENGHRPQAVIMVPGILELDLGSNSATRMASSENAMDLRRRAA